MQIQIKNRWSGAVLFECDVPTEVSSGAAMRYALERAIAMHPYASLRGASLRRADLTDADLTGADLTDADLTGANLTDADLRDADLRRANLRRANLRGADLRGANLIDADLTRAELRGTKADFFDILLRAPQEVAGLRAALVEGRVDGSTYTGPCACLVGTIAKVRGATYSELGNGIKPDSLRPAERWFRGIRGGDTPNTNQVSALTVAWLDEFVGLLHSATSGA